MSVTSSPITTGGGIAGISAAVVDLLYFGLVQHTVSPNINADLLAIWGGVFFIFSKDFNVTGGSKPNG